jgi:hypothetical protein
LLYVCILSSKSLFVIRHKVPRYFNSWYLFNRIIV